MKAKKNLHDSVFFIVAAPVGTSPSQRFRFEHFLSNLDEQKIKYRISPYFSEKGRKILYSKKNLIKKIAILLWGLLKRLGDLFRIISYKYVYIHREAAPVGPPFFEWVITKIFRKKIIYDFDDSIWVPAMSEYNKGFLPIKYFSKVRKICKWAYKVSVGNDFLKEYAIRYNENVIVVPTVVNTRTTHGIVQSQKTLKPSVGWTGSFSTLIYLDIVLPALKRLQEKADFTFYVIADKDPALPLPNYQFIKWRKETETDDLLRFHIGLMPLTDDEITRGKCGFKAIQYMALGMPALVSPVGVNTKIVRDGVDGFVCTNTEDWEDKMRLLLQDVNLRTQMGLAARKKIENEYSVTAIAPRFLSLFK